MTNTKTRFNIVPFKNPSGKDVFRVTGCDHAGKQYRLNFPTIESATVRQQALENEYLGLPQPDMHKVSTKLSVNQIADAEAALHRLDGKASLVEVADFYLTHYREPVIRKPLVDAFAEFIRDKQTADRRPDTIRNLKGRVGQFCKKHPAKLVSDILLADVEEFINRSGNGAYGRMSDRSVLSGFFNWCVKRKFCQSNPAEHVTPVKVDQSDPIALSLGEARRLVTAAMGYKDGACLPYVALGLFCAIRPAELARLTWDKINLKSRELEISGGAAKKRKRRMVDISKNAAEMLAPHALAQTPIRSANWRRDFDAVKVLAGFTGRVGDKANEGLTPWTPDVMRHSGITYHISLHKSADRTALWAGTSAGVIDTHYKVLTGKRDVAAFWSIGSASGAKVVKLKAA